MATVRPRVRAAAALANAGRVGVSHALLNKLAQQQAPDGHLDRRESVTQGSGQSLHVETTALSALAWQKRPRFAAQAQKAVDWLRQQRHGSGHFGTTQATVLALKALLGTGPATGASGDGRDGRDERGTGTQTQTIVVSREGTKLGEVTFAADHVEPLTISGLATGMQPGQNTLKLQLTGDGRQVSGRRLAYTLDVRYHAARPANDDRCPLRLATKLASAQVTAGEVVTLDATVTNSTDNGQPMTVAILGLPAGLEPRTAQLDELKDKGVIDYFELRPREVICYWRTLAPRQTIDLRLDLTAEIPGRYTGPASRVYLYYSPELTHWIDPLTVRITP